jgi:hypothetical protein
MPVEMGMWRIDGDTPKRLSAATLPSEATLEDYLEHDPSLLGDRLLVIGRQVRTDHNKIIDLLAIDSEATVHILELKRDRTPRDVVAQVLDYGAWVESLDNAALKALTQEQLGIELEVAFSETFGSTDALDERAPRPRMTIVATDLDPGSERIVTYLQTFGVPINAVFFAYLEDGDRRYLTRSWLTPPDEAASAWHTGKGPSRAEWNGRDWFVSFGDRQGRSWEDGLAYGFVSAGGDPWYSRTLRNLPVGARVNVHIPGVGYVGVGETLAEASRFDRAQVQVGGEWVDLAGQELHAPYRHVEKGQPENDDTAEWVVPVRWSVAHPASEAYWEKGMFANQNSACRLRQEFSLDRLASHFNLDE